MPLKPQQHEVKPAVGSVDASRFYIIEPQLSDTGYAVVVRRVGNDKVIWRCATTFETDAAMRASYGDSVESMVELAKHDLDKGFVK